MTTTTTSVIRPVRSERWRLRRFVGTTLLLEVVMPAQALDNALLFLQLALDGRRAEHGDAQRVVHPALLEAHRQRLFHLLGARRGDDATDDEEHL